MTVILLFSAAAITDSRLREAPWHEGLIIPLVLLPLWFLAAQRPAICLREDHLLVRNPFGTRRIRLDDVYDVQPGYFGLRIIRHSGRTATGWAVQEANAAKGWETRAAEISSCIRAAAPNSRPEEAPLTKYRTVVGRDGKIRRIAE